MRHWIRGGSNGVEARIIRRLTRTVELRYHRDGGIEDFEFYCKTNHFLAADNCGRIINL